MGLWTLAVEPVGSGYSSARISVEYSIWSCSTSYSKITIALKAYALTPPLTPVLDTDS